MEVKPTSNHIHSLNQANIRNQDTRLCHYVCPLPDGKSFGADYQLPLIAEGVHSVALDRFSQ